MASAETSTFPQSLTRSTVADQLFWCVVDHCNLNIPYTNPHKFLTHLYTKHFIEILDACDVFTFLQQYVDYYKVQINEFAKGNEDLSVECIDAESDPQNFFSSASALNEVNPIQILKDNVHLFKRKDPLILGNDLQIRKSLLHQKLQSILQIQHQERISDHLLPAPCLFCANISSSKYALFEHMFKEHSFNIGLLDNLVEVGEMLDVLRNQLKMLVCIYCERTFHSALVLRQHMRKKKHFKIHPKNHRYDKYYVVNFTEPGKSWDVLEDERNSRTSHQPSKKIENQAEILNELSDTFSTQLNTDSTEDSSDSEVIDQFTVCIFDSKIFSTPHNLISHLQNNHHFNLKQILTFSPSYSIYSAIQIVNYLRTVAYSLQCLCCTDQFQIENEYVQHSNDHFVKMDLPQIIFNRQHEWQNEKYLIPAIENDPLLTILEELTAD